jgi:hypothetical protein
VSNDDFETVRVALRRAAEFGVDSHGIAWLALQRIQDALAITAQIAARNGEEMLKAQGRAERAEDEVERLQIKMPAYMGHVRASSLDRRRRWVREGD